MVFKHQKFESEIMGSYNAEEAVKRDLVALVSWGVIRIITVDKVGIQRFDVTS